jgi:hypothetical protein
MICDDYDLCSDCFEKRKFNKEHLVKHPVVRFDENRVLFGKPLDVLQGGQKLDLKYLKQTYKNEIHSDVSCDICGKESIEGLRFKCDICSNFDLCLSCFESKEVKYDGQHEWNHPLIVIGKEVSLKVEASEIEIGQELGNGAFGRVYKATYRNRTVACKKLGFKPELLKSFLRELSAYNEIKGLCRVSHIKI